MEHQKQIDKQNQQIEQMKNEMSEISDILIKK